MATLAGRAYIEVAYDPTSIETMRKQVAAEGQKAGSSFASSFAKSGPALTRVGHTLTRSLTLPIGLAGAAATKYAYDFSQSLNHISALVGVGGKQMDEYRSAILALSPAVGQGPTQLADALYFITSSGYKGAAALDVLKASAKGAASGLGDTKTIADLVTSAVTVYGEKNLSASKAVDVLTQAVRDGKGEPDQYATALGRLIPIANSMGISFDQTAASVASLTLAGFSVDKAVTGMQSVFTNLSKPTTTGAAALQKVGLSYQGIRTEIKDKGLLPALLDMNKAFDGNQVALRQVFSSGKAIVPFLALTGQAAGRTSKTFDDLANSTGASNKAFETQSKTTAFQVQKAMAQIQTSAVALGSILLPIFAKVVGVVAQAAQAFAELPTGMQEVAVGGAAIAFALGPVLTIAGNLVKVTGFLTSGFSSLGSAIGGTSAPLVTMSADAEAAAGSAGLLSAGILGPLGIVAAASIGVGALVILTSQTTTLKGALDGAASSAHDLATATANLPGARLGVKQAKLTQKTDTGAEVAAQKRVNQLVADGKKGTQEYTDAVNARNQAQLTAKASTLGVAAAQGQLNDSLQAGKAARKETLDSLDKIAGVARRASLEEGHFSIRVGTQRDVANKAAAATAKYAQQTGVLAGQLESGAKKAGGMATASGQAQTKTAALALAAHDLADKLGRVPTQKEINVYYKKNLDSLIRQAELLGSAIDHLQSKQLSVTTSFRTYHTRPHTGGLVLPGGGLALAGGGIAEGGIPGRDSIPALLTPGELVLNKQQQLALLHGGMSGGDVYVSVKIGEREVENAVVTVQKRTARTVKAGRKW